MEAVALDSRFAIFLPVRNGADYILEAIDSVLAQTRSDWRLYILDNSSDDATTDIVTRCKHHNVHLFHSARSLTIWESWHRVWQMLSNAQVKADYVTIIGHDDCLHPTFLEAIDRLISDEPDATLYQTGFDMIDQLGKLLRPCKPIPSKESGIDFLGARMWGLRDSYGTGYVFRPSDYVAVGGIPNLPRLMYSDDLLFARLANRGYKAAVRDSHCNYRLHRASASNGMNASCIAAKIEAVERFIQCVEDEFSQVFVGRAGQSMIACLLARDVLLLHAFVDTPLLPLGSRQTIARLADRYRQVSRGIEYHQWLGANFISRHVYARTKQAMLLGVLIRDKWTQTL